MRGLRGGRAVDKNSIGCLVVVKDRSFGVLPQFDSPVNLDSQITFVSLNFLKCVAGIVERLF